MDALYLVGKKNTFQTKHGKRFFFFNSPTSLHPYRGPLYTHLGSCGNMNIINLSWHTQTACAVHAWHSPIMRSLIAIFTTLQPRVFNLSLKIRFFVVGSPERKGKNLPPPAVFFALCFPAVPPPWKAAKVSWPTRRFLTTSNRRRRKLSLTVITEILHLTHVPLSSRTQYICVHTCCIGHELICLT